MTFTKGFPNRKRCTRCRDWKAMPGGAGYKTGWVCKDCKPAALAQRQKVAHEARP